MTSIYEFKDFSAFLRFVTENSATNRRVSKLNHITNKLGYSSPRSVAMVLKRQRPASQDMIRRLAEHLHLRAAEKDYLELINARELRLIKKASTEDLDKKIEKARPRPVEFEKIQNSLISSFTKWHVLALKALSRGSPLPADTKKLAKYFKFKVEAGKLKEAFGDLERLGVVRYNHESRVYENTFSKGLTTHFDIPSAAIQEYHRQVSSLAQEALGTQSVLDREFVGVTLKVDKDRLPELKKRMRDFYKEILGEFDSDEARTVYQLNLQLFELAELEKEGKK